MTAYLGLLSGCVPHTLAVEINGSTGSTLTLQKDVGVGGEFLMPVGVPVCHACTAAKASCCVTFSEVLIEFVSYYAFPHLKTENSNSYTIFRK